MRIWLAAFVLVALVPSIAHAEDACPNEVGGDHGVDEIDHVTRLRWLASTLDRESTNADVWTYGWITAGVAATAVNGTLAAVGDYDARVDGIGAAAGTAMLTLSTALDPLSVPDGAAIAGGESGCRAVHRFEKTLATVAADEEARQRWTAHALPIAGVTAGFLVMGLGYDRWTSGALNAAIGIVASEIKILTQPMGAARGLAQYRRGALDAASPKLGWSLAPTMGKNAGGVSLSILF